MAKTCQYSRVNIVANWPPGASTNNLHGLGGPVPTAPSGLNEGLEETLILHKPAHLRHREINIEPRVLLKAPTADCRASHATSPDSLTRINVNDGLPSASGYRTLRRHNQTQNQYTSISRGSQLTKYPLALMHPPLMNWAMNRSFGMVFQGVVGIGIMFSEL